MKTKKTTFLIVFLLLVASSVSDVSAAVLSLNTKPEVQKGERTNLDIIIDPEKDSINSVGLSLRFDSHKFRFAGFSAKQSSIPIWVEEPKEREKGIISFSGVIPGGIEHLYDPLHTASTAIPLVRLFFVAENEGADTFSFADTLVLKNDGKGSLVPVTTKDTTVTISGTLSENVHLSDTTPPKPFTITLIERSFFGKTPRLAVFSAEDDSSAIEHYEVSVGGLSFVKATSPYPLPYKLFPYVFSVKAFDFSGNVTEQQITISGEKPYGVGILFAILAIAFLLYRFYTRRKLL